jgi:uncharacterized repeat protein (TIGR03803 family)
MTRSRVLPLLAFFLLLGLSASAQQTPVLSNLFSFPCTAPGDCPDGFFPISLIESADGNFYGAAAGGGTGLNAQGTIFKITPAGELSVIYSFAEEANGALPNGSSPGALVEGTDGFLYGLTLVNGANGLGTLFKLSKRGKIQVVHNFCGTENCSDGANPETLTLGLDGNFYGGTASTGFPTSVLFRMSPSGSYKVLHTFDSKSQPDGTGVYNMLQAPDGNYYGTTVAGAQFNPYNSVFRFSPSSGEYTILHGFNTANINLPGVATSGLAMTSTGEFFGLEAFADLYKVSPSGAYHKLGSLSSIQFFDGHIIVGSDGNLWGDFAGGDCGSGQGIEFSASTSGSLLQSQAFDCNTIGEQPSAMLQAADGKFYGVTLGDGGGSTNDVTNGTIWTLDAGLPAPGPTVVNFRPVSGAVGTKVIVQGSHLVGTTTVSVNGVSATFQVLTANYLSLTIPSGASSGPISVTNAGGTATSPKPFTVK